MSAAVGWRDGLCCFVMAVDVGRYDVGRYDVVALTYIVRYHIMDEVSGRSFGGCFSNIKEGDVILGG